MALNTNSLDIEASSAAKASIADTASLSITGDMTLECWYKPESQPGTDAYSMLMSKYLATGNQRSFYFAYADSSGTKRMSVSLSTDGSATVEKTVNQTLTNGTWYHLAFVYTASGGGGEFFVNGSSIGTVTGYPTSIFNSTADFIVGQSPDGQADGLIDDVRVWNAVKTEAAIAASYQQELVGNESNLQGYWKLNNDLEDSTSNNNDLTGSNTAFSTDVPFVGTDDSSGGGFFFISS